MSAMLSWKGDLLNPLGGTLRFDIVTNEVPYFSSTITEYPVETGANVTDHVRSNLTKLSLEVFVSNSPITGQDLTGGAIPRGFYEPHLLDIPRAPIRSLASLMNAGIDLLKGIEPPKALLLTFRREFNAALETLDILDKLRRDATLIEVISRDWYLDGMVIESISEPRTAEEGDGAKFTIELKQIRIVETKQTSLPIPTEPRAKKSISNGKKDGKEVPAPPPGSTLFGLIGGAL